ncbi:MAG: formylglycine-generating enzyme family protein [Aestuariibacter sp.]|nr:formylglycine-generating enzyme family protein [Aestuariibacter sp.]
MKTNQYLLVRLVIFLCLTLFAAACSPPPVDEELEATAQAEEALNVDGVLTVGPIQKSEQDDMMLVNVPAGEFLMGGYAADRRASDREKPLHIVHVDSYWIDQTEVSNAMFAAFVKDTGYVTDAEKEGSSPVWTTDGRQDIQGAAWNHPQGPDSNLDGVENHPVMHVSWNDAATYCAWAGRRLPTEAEWEKAARGIDGRFYPWGDEFDSSFVNVDDETLIDKDMIDCDASGCDGYALTAPVGSLEKGASPYGVLNMGGNLIEWTADYYDEFYYAQGVSDNPQGPPEGDRRVIRGGSWLNLSWDVRATRRYGQRPTLHSDKLGFRCATSDF